LASNAFVQVTIKATMPRIARSPTGASPNREPKNAGTIDKVQRTDKSNFPGLGAELLQRDRGDEAAFKGSDRELVDLTEDVDVLIGMAGTVKNEELASSPISELTPQQAAISTKATGFATSADQDITVTRLSTGSLQLVPCLSIPKRESTLFCFNNDSNEITRMRPFATCDTVGKIFPQADVAGLVRKLDEETALYLTILGTERLLIVPSKDDESFKELVEAIGNVQLLE
jgi:hypothetical protein